MPQPFGAAWSDGHELLGPSLAGEATLVVAEQVPQVRGERARRLKGDRIARTDGDLARLTANIGQWRTNLWRLADEVAGFVTEQQALARANAMIREVDRRGLPAPAPADASGELADHTTAVLAAYRELTQLVGVEFGHH